MALAAAGSAALHLLLLLGLAVLVVLEARFPVELPEPPEPEAVEVTVVMPEILIPETLPEDDVPPLPEDEAAREKARRTYVRTTQNDREPSAPDDAPFESDRNTTAAAEAAAAADPDAPVLPSMEGMDLPSLELIDREFTDGRFADESTRGEQGPEDPSPAANPSDPVPPAPPVPPTEITEVVDGEPTPPSEQDGSLDERPETPADGTALLAKSEPPRAREALEEFPSDPSVNPLEVAEPPEIPDIGTSDEPEVREPSEIALEEAGALRRQQDRLLDQLTPPSPRPPSDARPPSEPRPRPGDPMASERDVFQPHTRRRHFEGGINRRGQSAVDAAETPVGRYGKLVNQAISRQWHLYRIANADFLTYGNMKVEFQITRDGRIENLRILEKAPNAVMTDFTLNAILDARIPAIPADVLPILEDGRFNMSYQIIIY